MSDYQPDRYWESLLGEKFDLSGVGHPEFPESFNRALYQQMLRSVSAMVTAHGVRVADADVLEIGPGTGFWVQLWDELGADSVTGVDITVTAVDHLAARFPRHRFVVGDLGDAGAGEFGTFDLVSAMSVLLHIVDDSRFRTALTNIAAMVSSDGVVLLMEPLVLHRWWGPPFGPTANSRARTVEEWHRALGEADLELVDQRPVTALLANVCDTRHRGTWRLHQAYWGLLRVLLARAPALSRPVTSVLSAVDQALVARGVAPSAKIMLVRRAR